jgi:hypothetical protein
MGALNLNRDRFLHFGAYDYARETSSLIGHSSLASNSAANSRWRRIVSILAMSRRTSLKREWSVNCPVAN